MPNLLLSDSINTIEARDNRLHSYEAALRGNLSDYIRVMYLLELIRAGKRAFVSPAHAYVYARVQYNEPQTRDHDVWNKYLNKYGAEIETTVATQMLNHIAELATAILNTQINQRSAGLPKDLYDSLLKCDKTFAGYKNNPIYESIELSLRHMDITESDKKAREHIFTIAEIAEMFSSCLTEFIRPVTSHEDLMERTTSNALLYTTTILSIIYRIFSKSRNQYWYDWEVKYKSDTCSCKDAKSWINTVPVRTPEAVLGLTGREIFSCKSIEIPVEIDGPVDRYLTTIY